MKITILAVTSIAIFLVALGYVFVPLLIYAYLQSHTYLLDNGIYGAYSVREYVSTNLTSPQASGSNRTTLVSTVLSHYPLADCQSQTVGQSFLTCLAISFGQHLASMERRRQIPKSSDTKTKITSPSGRATNYRNQVR
jgi:hypothetical protein